MSTLVGAYFKVQWERESFWLRVVGCIALIAVTANLLPAVLTVLIVLLPLSYWSWRRSR